MSPTPACKYLQFPGGTLPPMYHNPIFTSSSFHFTAIIYEEKSYSGRKLTRLGRSVDWSFLMSTPVSLQPSNVSDLKFFSDFRCRSPALVTRELDTFNDTSPVNPAFTQNIISRVWRINSTYPAQHIIQGYIWVAVSHSRLTMIHRNTDLSQRSWNKSMYM